MIRRQTQEALVHYIDGVLALDKELSMVDPNLAADGVDEMINVMLCGVPDWAHLERTSGIIELKTIDTKDAWTVAFGRMTGVSPSSGESYDLDALELVHDVTPDVLISANALDLDLWLWGRPEGASVRIDGAPELVSKLRELITSSTQ